LLTNLLVLLVGPRRSFGTLNPHSLFFSEISCGKPTMLPGVQLVIGRSYLYHDRVFYVCRPGLRPEGTSVLRCLDTGQWSSETKCKGMQCSLRIYPQMQFSFTVRNICNPLHQLGDCLSILLIGCQCTGARLQIFKMCNFCEKLKNTPQ
jgi:hypothetical protein